MDASNFSGTAPHEIHRHATRVHLDLLDLFIALTERAKIDSSSEFLSESLDDQIEWLSNLKSGYGS